MGSFATKEYNFPTDHINDTWNVLFMVASLIQYVRQPWNTIFTHIIGTSCFCSGGWRLSCCADITLTRAFLQEDDLGLWEEVGAADDHLFSPADQTAGQAGFLNLGQLLSWTLGWERRSRRWGKKENDYLLSCVHSHGSQYFKRNTLYYYAVYTKLSQIVTNLYPYLSGSPNTKGSDYCRAMVMAQTELIDIFTIYQMFLSKVTFNESKQ